eukprot:COSAG05_NODE_119_length_17779_cov_273.146049_11_plen_88_part_00
MRHTIERISAMAAIEFPASSMRGWWAQSPPTPGMEHQTAPLTPDLAGSPTEPAHSPDASYLQPEKKNPSKTEFRNIPTMYGPSQRIL